jgi:uncharacterized paraquat-inducible protein A
MKIRSRFEYLLPYIVPCTRQTVASGSTLSLKIAETGIKRQRKLMRAIRCRQVRCTKALGRFAMLDKHIQVFIAKFHLQSLISQPMWISMVYFKRFVFLTFISKQR